MSSAAEKWEIQLARSDFSVFNDSFVYTPPQFPPSPMHRDIERLLNTAYGKYRFILLTAPRSSAKSERVTINYPSWMIGNNPNLRITICSTPAEKAVKFLSKVTERIESDKTYQKIFGVLRPESPKTWRTDAVTVKRTITSPDPSISAIGAAGQAVSKRADIIIVDDPLDNENTKTEYLREMMIRWFNDGLLPTLEPNGLLIAIMTPWHEADLSQYLSKQSGWVVKKYPVINEPIKENMDKWLATEDASLTVWPEKYGYKMPVFDNAGEPVLGPDGKQLMVSFLRDIYNKSVDTFFTQYLLDPFNVRGAMFNEEWLTYYVDKDLDWSKMLLYQGWDLNISVEESADYMACATCGFNVDTKLVYLLEMWRDHVSLLNQFNTVINKFEWWSKLGEIRQITIEADAYQKTLSMGLLGNTTLPVVPSESKGKAKEDRIALLAPHFESRRIKIPEYMRGGEFVSEYKRFPKAQHDDQLDALQKCLEPVLGRVGTPPLAWGEVRMI